MQFVGQNRVGQPSGGYNLHLSARPPRLNADFSLGDRVVFFKIGALPNRPGPTRVYG